MLKTAPASARRLQMESLRKEKAGAMAIIPPFG